MFRLTYYHEVLSVNIVNFSLLETDSGSLHVLVLIVVVLLVICAWSWGPWEITTLVWSTVLHLLTKLHRISWLLRETNWRHPHIRHSGLLKGVVQRMGRRHMTLRQTCRLNSDTLGNTSTLHHGVRKKNVVPWHAV